MNPLMTDFYYHAVIRGQQRGIKPQHTALIYKYGSIIYNRGRLIFYLSRKDWQALLNDNESLPLKRRTPAQELERLRKMYLVDDNGRVVTVGHRHKNKSFKRNQ